MYERECLRQAEQAHSSERRIKLLEHARVWADAALAVEVDEATGDVLSPSSRPAHRTRSRRSSSLKPLRHDTPRKRSP